MNLLANLFRSAWARIAQRPEADRGPLRRAEGPERVNAPGALSAEALMSAGLECLHGGDLVAAVNYFKATIGRAPDSPGAHYNLGVALLRQKRYEEAIDCFARAMHYRPHSAQVRFQLGLAQFHLERYDEAIESLRRAAELDPESADAHCNLGYVLYKHLDQLDLAEAHLRRALELDPQKVEAQTNLAIVLDQRGETDAALEMYDRILRAKPDDSEVRLNRALIWLARGDYERGWPEYEARHALQSRRDFGLPAWDGSSLEGRTILVHAEQGLGDEIMFASCLGDVIDQAGHCVIECHPKLEKLFRRSFPAASVHGALQTDSEPSWLEQALKIDFRVGIASLPRHFRRSLADFPGRTGYLRADPGRRAYWLGRLGELGSGPKVGISWRGGTRQTRRRMRSIPLEQWAPLLAVPGGHFVSLQYGDCLAEIDALHGASRVRVHHWPEAIDDYDETAALVSALDLVISVQTALIHLGGALGRPVWALVTSRPEWRYQETGESLPWYPSVRLIRQPAPGDWRAVIDEGRQRLERWPG